VGGAVVNEFALKTLVGVKPAPIRIPRHNVDIPEAKLQEITLAHANRIPGVKVWRMNTGAAEIGGSWVKFGEEGQADLAGLMAPSGRRLEIELKAKRGRLRAKQAEYGEMIEKHGGLYIVARTLSQALIPICEALGLPYEEYDVKVAA